MKTFKASLSELDDSAWGIGILVPKEIANHFKQNNIKRLICTINGKESWNSAILNSKSCGHYIYINKERRKKLKLDKDTRFTIELKEDISKYGMPLPAELKELFDQDIIGQKYFHKLTPGKQRSLLHYIGKLKSSDKRIEKSVVLLDYLVETKGILDFKELHNRFKNNKFRL